MRDITAIQKELENHTAAQMVNVYVRVSKDKLPLSPKSFYFHHRPLPSTGSTKLMGGKPPQVIEPLKHKSSKAEDTERRLILGLKDMRILQNRTRSRMRYLNIMSHSLDIMGLP